jgi:uncharacterized integral membrane protein
MSNAYLTQVVIDTMRYSVVRMKQSAVIEHQSLVALLLYLFYFINNDLRKFRFLKWGIDTCLLMGYFRAGSIN